MSEENESNSLSPRILSSTWEIEILISGGAYYSLYQLSSAAADLLSRFGPDVVTTPLFTLSLLPVSFRLLSIYFIVHLSLRAFWLSLLLLQKVYPGGVNVENLNMAEPFKSKSASFDLCFHTQRLDKISSLVFAWAIAFSLALAGLSVAMGIVLLPIQIHGYFFPGSIPHWSFKVAAAITTISFDLFLLDLITYGLLRRKKWIAKIYYPIYLAWNTVTLGFLWRPQFQVIFSNVKSKWKASGLVLIATIAIVFLSLDEDDALSLLDSRKETKELIFTDEYRYLDRRPRDEWMRGTYIQSDVITEGYLKVFVVMNQDDSKHLDSLKSDTKYFSELITLSVDDSVYTASWITLNRLDNEKGIQTVLDVSRLKNAMHLLQIKRSYSPEFLVIPFWIQQRREGD